MERRFACTACGKCCHGLLPLTIDDALRHADVFPLAVMWEPIRPGGRSFDTVADLGLVVPLKNRRKIAIRLSPVAYIPASFPCPQLTAEGLCGIHESKPQRCRTMPFSASRAESDQDDLLLPKPGWACDTSTEAPLVYRDRSILERADFDAERTALKADATFLVPYAKLLLAVTPSLSKDIAKMSMKSGSGKIVLSFSTLVRSLPKVDIFDLADQQAPLVSRYAERAEADPDLKDFHKRYKDMADEWTKIAASRAAKA